MKRPEGFDPGARKPRQAETVEVPAAPAKKNKADAAATPALPVDSHDRARRDEKSAHRELRAAQRELRKAERARKRFERGEVKRFTRRTRTRRAVWITALTLVGALVAAVAVAVFSPLLALSDIRVTGTERLSSKEIVAAVDHQRGTPLALLDLGEVKRDLSEFALIRSFVTETVPPSTLIIHIVEREPVASVTVDKSFHLVDPAGVVIDISKKRPEGLPTIKVPGEPKAGEVAFDSAVEVLLALPNDLVPQVKVLSATTRDDVTFTLRDSNQRVVWGSAERSAFKARVLEALLSRSDSDEVVEFDISSPDTVVTKKR